MSIIIHSQWFFTYIFYPEGRFSTMIFELTPVPSVSYLNINRWCCAYDAEPTQWIINVQERTDPATEKLSRSTYGISTCSKVSLWCDPHMMELCVNVTFLYRSSASSLGARGSLQKSKPGVVASILAQSVSTRSMADAATGSLRSLCSDSPTSEAGGAPGLFWLNLFEKSTFFRRSWMTERRLRTFIADRSAWYCAKKLAHKAL